MGSLYINSISLQEALKPRKKKFKKIKQLHSFFYKLFFISVLKRTSLDFGEKIKKQAKNKARYAVPQKIIKKCPE